MTINHASIAEQKRAGIGGKFGSKATSAPISGLAAPAPVEMPQVEMRFHLQRWERDYAIEIGSADVDGRAILDSLDLDDVRGIRDYNGAEDAAFDTAYQNGMIDHDGPWHIDVDEEQLDEYIAAREAAGREQGGLIVRRDTKAIQNDLRSVQQQIEDLENRRGALRQSLVASAVLEKAPHATEVSFTTNEYGTPIGPHVYDADGVAYRDDEIAIDEIQAQLCESYWESDSTYHYEL